jgi:hypothetical protein
MREVSQIGFLFFVVAEMPCFTGFAAARVLHQLARCTERVRAHALAQGAQCCDSRCEVDAKRVFRQRNVARSLRLRLWI